MTSETTTSLRSETRREALAKEIMAESAPAPAIPTGPAAAAILAAGFGCFALALLIALSEGIASVKTLLTFNGPVGPLSGKTIVAVAAWLLAWVGLHLAWRKRDVKFGKVAAAAMVLVLLGLLGTFPPFYGIFSHE
jgi:hypothetical protein